MTVAIAGVIASGCAQIGGDNGRGVDDDVAGDADAGTTDDGDDDGFDDVDDGADAGTPATQIEVPGMTQWSDTGLDLAPGEHVAVTATGEVAHGGGGEYGPNGDLTRTNFAANVVNCFGHVGLIGRVGAAGDPFFVGSETSFAATTADRLFLGVNDVGVDNNAGEFEAEVTPGLSHEPIASGAVNVPGTAAWTDTGIDIAAGDQLTVTASGTVIHGVANNDGCDPSGEPATSNHGANAIACPNHASLIAKIGTGGNAFYVGRLTSIPTTTAGRLYLGVNDIDLTNNAGAYSAAVTVTRR